MTLRQEMLNMVAWQAVKHGFADSKETVKQYGCEMAQDHARLGNYLDSIQYNVRAWRRFWTETWNYVQTIK